MLLGLKVNTTSPELVREPYFTDGVALLETNRSEKGVAREVLGCLCQLDFLSLPNS